MTQIAFKDIRQGDTIRHTETRTDGTVITMTGVAANRGTTAWRTSGGDELATVHYSETLELVDRPRVPLPTESGTIIMATVLLDDDGPIPMYLDYNSKWVKIPDGFNQDPENIEEWYLIDTEQKDVN